MAALLLWTLLRGSISTEPLPDGRMGTRGGSMRICVVGIGAVGGYCGGRLAEAGGDVVFVARGETHDYLLSRGLRVESLCGDFQIDPVHVVRTPVDAGVVDAVLVAVKAWQIPEVAASLRPLVEVGADVNWLGRQAGVATPLFAAFEAALRPVELASRAGLRGGADALSQPWRIAP
jgi:prephenate dehydrogenase